MRQRIAHIDRSRLSVGILETNSQNITISSRNNRPPAFKMMSSRLEETDALFRAVNPEVPPFAMENLNELLSKTRAKSLDTLTSIVRLNPTLTVHG